MTRGETLPYNPLIWFGEDVGLRWNSWGKEIFRKGGALEQFGAVSKGDQEADVRVCGTSGRMSPGVENTEGGRVSPGFQVAQRLVSVYQKGKIGNLYDNKLALDVNGAPGATCDSI